MKQVQAYEAMDGSLHKTEQSCALRNKSVELDEQIKAFLNSRDPSKCDIHLQAFARTYIPDWESFKEGR